VNTKNSQAKISKKLLIGITGGVGAGKSVVAEFLRKKAYPVFSADEIAREVVAPGSPALEEIRKLFGSAAIRADGSLDRAYMRSRILQDSSLRLRLEAITHPRIQSRAQELSLQAFRDGAQLVFYEAPLLFEAKGERKLDKIICVHADDEIRIQRVMQRDKCARDQAESLLRSQMPQEEKKRRSDFLIRNEGDQAELEKETESVLNSLLALVQ
jgi:dephospho-CoA kinase